MRVPDPKANTTTEAYLAYKAGYLEESELKPKLYEPDLHFDGWLAYWAGLVNTYPTKENGDPEMLCDEEALVAYLSGVTNTYPEEIKDPYDVRIVGYLRHLASIRWPEPDYPVNNEEFYLSTMEPTHTSNPEPSSDIELDTAEGKIISVEAYGDTYQQTYSGKNLLLPNPRGSVSNGITASYDATTGVVTLSGRATANWSNAFIDMPVNLPAGTYTFSATTESSIGRNIIFFNGSTNILQKALSATATSVECVVSEAITSLRLWLSPTNGTDYTGKTFKAQLEIGNQATSFEPYVGGEPAPNPDYPQEIQTVTGEQTVTVTGKNLYNLTSGPTTESGVTGIGTTEYFTMDGAVSGAGGRLVFNECTLPAGTYTATTYCDSGEIVGNVNFCVYKKNTWSQVTNFVAMKFFPSGIGTSKTTTFTLSEETSLWFSAYLNTNASFENLEGRFQLEKGSTATTYQPFQSQTYTVDLGSIELCKIGDYQDYIYKGADGWYLHKETNSKTLNGSEVGWGKSGTSSNNAYYLSTAIFSDINRDGMGVGVSDTHVTPSFSYYFVPQSSNNIFASNVVGLGFNAQQSPSTNIDLRIGMGLSSTLNTLQLFEDWLALNPVTIYYVLATATDTKITDATLIGQLEALAGADTYNEKTYIKVTANDPNLPALLKVEAYKY